MKGVFFLHIRRWQFSEYWEHKKMQRRAGLKPVYYIRIANAHIFYFFFLEITVGASWKDRYVKDFGAADCEETNKKMTRFRYEVRGKNGAIVYLWATNPPPPK